MAIIYYPKGALLGYRDSFNPLYEQLSISTSPSTVIYFDSASAAQGVSSSGLFITCSWALTASVTILLQSSSVADTANVANVANIANTASCVVGNFSNVNSYKLSSSYSNTYTSSITMSYVDDGKLINMTSGSASVAFITSGLSSTFNAMFYQSGSGAIVFTGSGVVLRNRSSQTGSAGQYAVVTLLRVSNGDFVLGGDTA